MYLIHESATNNPVISRLKAFSTIMCSFGYNGFLWSFYEWNCKRCNIQYIAWCMYEQRISEQQIPRAFKCAYLRNCRDMCLVSWNLYIPKQHPIHCMMHVSDSSSKEFQEKQIPRTSKCAYLKNFIMISPVLDRAQYPNKHFTMIGIGTPIPILCPNEQSIRINTSQWLV